MANVRNIVEVASGLYGQIGFLCRSPGQVDRLDSNS
jgi:hypothetical protein